MHSPDTTPAATAAPAQPAVQPLFRKQAVEHVATRQYGTIILARSVSHTALTALFVTLAVGIIAFFALFGTTRKAQSQGVLLPTAGVIRVLPSQAGVITENRVREGQSVRKGEVLFVLASERNNGAAESAEQTVSNLLTSRLDSFSAELKDSSLQTRQRLAAMQRRAEGLASEVARIGDQIALQEKRVALAEAAYKRFSQLQATSYISAAQLQDKQAELLDQRQRMADLHRARSATEREHLSAEAEVRDLQVQGKREANALQRNVSVLRQDLTENEARREIMVRAPQDGMVTAITAEVGQTVAPNSVLAAVLPAGSELEAEIYAPSRSAGFIKPGMQVLLRYQAYPYQKFGQHKAVVKEVANTSLQPNELAVPGAAAGAGSEPLYRIRLKLEKQSVLAYGETMPLKSGMLVDASIMLEHRRLYEWVLEPVFSVSGKL